MNEEELIEKLNKQRADLAALLQALCALQRTLSPEQQQAWLWELAAMSERKQAFVDAAGQTPEQKAALQKSLALMQAAEQRVHQALQAAPRA